MRQSSNENVANNVYAYNGSSILNFESGKDWSISTKAYCLDRQSSINSLVETDSWYTKDNSFWSQFARDLKHASSNGFSENKAFDPYSHGSSFKTPRQKDNPQLASLNRKLNGNEEKNINIANRNIKIRAVDTAKFDWKTRSNGFKELKKNKFTHVCFPTCIKLKILEFRQYSKIIVARLTQLIFEKPTNEMCYQATVKTIPKIE